MPETLSAGDDHEGCPKCGHGEAETAGVAMTGDGLSRYVDYRNQAFVVVSCAACGYSEFYRRAGGGGLLDRVFGRRRSGRRH